MFPPFTQNHPIRYTGDDEEQILEAIFHKRFWGFSLSEKERVIEAQTKMWRPIKYEGMGFGQACMHIWGTEKESKEFYDHPDNLGKLISLGSATTTAEWIRSGSFLGGKTESEIEREEIENNLGHEARKLGANVMKLPIHSNTAQFFKSEKLA